MGVYYYFLNEQSEEENIKPIIGNCSFVAKLNSIDEDLIISYFETVIKVNNWKNSDPIIAYPDYPYHQILKYQNGKLEYIETDSE